MVDIDTTTADDGMAAGILTSHRIIVVSLAALLGFSVVLGVALAFISRQLPDEPGETLHFPTTSFGFAFGGGAVTETGWQVNEFSGGYALLTSGPVSVDAGLQHVLEYTWLPPRLPVEAAFFWRRADEPQNILRTEIAIPGTHLIDLSAGPDWRGNIIELGLLLAGDAGESVEIGDLSLLPDTLQTRLRLLWRSWTAPEHWSQQSINFLHGGDFRQVIALPLLVTAWLVLTLIILGLLMRLGKPPDSRQFLVLSGMLFLLAWIVLDIRWTANNLRQMQLSMETRMQSEEHELLGKGLDGAIYQYVHRLKRSVLGNEPSRVLIVHDESAIDYYVLRAKYHLLPHSARVTARFPAKMRLKSVSFVIFFGQPATITQVPGWNKAWQRSLVKIDSGEWGTVYRVNTTGPNGAQ